MKKLLLIAVIVVACRKSEPVATTTTVAPPPAAPAATTAAAESAWKLDPTGAYFAMDDLPADFAELEHLSLATIDENAAPAPLNGFLRPKDRNAQDYTLVSPKLDGQHLTFTTVDVNGVHYEFDGTFTTTGEFATNPPASDVAVLTGTLKKVREGSAVASTPVRFHYEAGG